MNPFENSPYQLDDEAARQLLSYLQRIEDRVATLRSAGRLTDETLRDYFGETRFIQVAESDKAGDIRSFAELLIDRIEGSLTGLESSARRKQGYSFITEKIRRQQENQLAIWNTSVKLLANMIEYEVGRLVDGVSGSCRVLVYPEMLDIDDYVEVCANRAVPRSFAFRIQIQVPGIANWEKLAFIGYRSARVRQHFGDLGGPSLYWSSRTNQGFHKWRADGLSSPFAVEITAAAGNGDRWLARRADDSIVELSTTELARSISESILQQMLTNGET